MTNSRDLTDKEVKVIEAFDSANPGMGERVEKDIRNENTGVREIVAAMDEENIKAVSKGKYE